MLICVQGIAWDEAECLESDMVIRVNEDDVVANDKESLHELISDELSNQTGFCHWGWESYKIEREDVA